MATYVDGDCRLPLLDHQGLSIKDCRKCRRRSTIHVTEAYKKATGDNQLVQDFYNLLSTLKLHKEYRNPFKAYKIDLSKKAKYNDDYGHNQSSRIYRIHLKLIFLLALQLAYTVPKPIHSQIAESQAIPIAYKNGFFGQPPTLYTNPNQQKHRQEHMISNDLAMTPTVGLIAGQEPSLPQLHELDWAKRVWPIGLPPSAPVPKQMNNVKDHHLQKSAGPVLRINLNRSSNAAAFKNRFDMPGQRIKNRQLLSHPPGGPKSAARGLFEFLMSPRTHSPLRAARDSGPRPFEGQYGLAVSSTVDPSPWPSSRSHENGQPVAKNIDNTPINNVVNLSAPYESPRKRTATLSGLFNLRSINQTTHNVSGLSRELLEPPTDGSTNPIAIAPSYESSYSNGDNNGTSDERTVYEQGDKDINDFNDDNSNDPNWRHQLHENQTWDEQQNKQSNGDSEEATEEYTLSNQQGEQQVDIVEEQQLQQPAVNADEQNQNQDAALVNQPETRSNESLMIQAASFDPANESYLAAQLPSQYDSVIRVPPDGHYDDYYKPEGNRINPSLSDDSMVAGSRFPHSQPSSYNSNQTNGGSSFDVEDFNANGPSHQIEITPSSQLRPEDEDTQYHNQEQSRFDKHAPVTVYHQTLPGSNHQQQIDFGRYESEQPHPRSRELASKQMPTRQSTLANDFTMQYYMNQRPLSQSEAQNDSAVEFLVSNATYTNQDGQADQYRPNRINQSTPHRNGSDSGDIESHQQLVEYPDGQDMLYAQTTRVPLLTLIDKNPAASVRGPGDQSKNNSFDADSWRNNKTARQVVNHNEQDDSNGSIRLILANTNSSWRDPMNNEKMISYTTSEGQDFAQPGGALSAPRHTFINKDLNESPPSNDTSTANANRLDINSNNNYTSARRDNSLNIEAEDLQSHDTPRISNKMQLHKLPEANRSASDEDDRSGSPNDDDSSGRTNNHQYRFTSGGRAMQNHQATVKPLSSRRSFSEKLNNGRSKKDVPIERKRRIPKSDHISGANYKSNPSVRTAQVTEAHFDPVRDLVLNAPTQSPSVPESAMSTIVELPGKVKKLRTHQADKNELMNELLTALDRVKSAIYKLQPLTAKMNAIYRKSVTSNTRDIIMDNHKGTYAKRYPPGDYDDTYDRLHPSELVERQRSSSARKGRRAPSNESTRYNNGTVARYHHSGGQRSSGRDDQSASASTTNSVYVTAPKEVAERFSRQSFNGSSDGTNSNRTEGAIISNVSEFELRSGPMDGGDRDEDKLDKLIIDGTKLIATGIGRREGLSRLRLGSNEASSVLYDDESGSGDDNSDQMVNKYIIEDSGVMPAARVRQQSNSGAYDANETRTSDEENLSPLFGYRITIYQTPVDETPDSSDNKTDSGTMDDISLLPTDGLLSYRVDDAPQDRDGSSSPEEFDPGETMTTSESSLAPLTPFESSIEPVRADTLNDAQDQLDRSESASSKKSAKKDANSSKKRNKSEKEEGDSESSSGSNKKKSMEKGGKKASKSAENHSRGKRVEEDKKRKKEFKKIKHNKGITSKESHKMHRDKQVKAHDRGAAKEKALKERTQIEFFEREQIVDDEFEKGKKSTMKANWASGHDAKKSSSKETGGDSLASGGSHFVKHYEPMEDAASSLMGNSEHGQTKSVETSSGKESNKFEKKTMEAKGKKFKGWREKGYKIITETEFIDRGSLHDSAYKKRDKGAAHHQKLKKHESSSEGHHGSIEERLKKLAKKEEKESTIEEKKKETMKKGKSGEKFNKDAFKFEKMGKKEMEEAKKKKSMQRAKHHKDDDDDHEQEESVGIGSIVKKPESSMANSTSGNAHKSQNFTNVAQVDFGNRSSSDLASKIGQIPEERRLARLLNADGHESTGIGSNRHPVRAQKDNLRADNAEKNQPQANKVELVISPDSNDSATNRARKLKYDAMAEAPVRAQNSPKQVGEPSGPRSSPEVDKSVTNDTQGMIIGSKERLSSVDKDGIRFQPQPAAPPSTTGTNRHIDPPYLSQIDLNDLNKMKDPYTNEKINLLANLIQATVAEQSAQRTNRVYRPPVQEIAANRYLPLENHAYSMPSSNDNKFDSHKMEQIGERESKQLIPPHLEQNVHIDPFDVASNPMNRMQNFIMPTFNNNHDLKIISNLGFDSNQPQIIPNFEIFQRQAFMDAYREQEPVARRWQLL